MQEDGTWTAIPRCTEHEPGVQGQVPGVCPGIPGYCSLDLPEVFVPLSVPWGQPSGPAAPQMVHGTHTLPVRETLGSCKMAAILAQGLLEVLETEMEEVEEEEVGQAEGLQAAEEEVMEEMEG